MRRLLAAAATLAALVLLPACDSGGAAPTPSFRVEVTGDAEATLTGRPLVGVFEDRAGTVYTFTLGSGFSVVTLGGVEPRVGTYDPSGSLVLLFGAEPALFTADEGEVVVESVEDRLVQARFAFSAEVGGEEGGRVRVEGTMTASLDDRLPTPPLP